MAETNSTTVPIPNSPRLKNLMGRRFGRLVVIGYAGSIKGFARWLCQCDCGNRKICRSYNLVQGQIRSCRCLARETTSAIFRKHGMAHGPEYRSWNMMNNRCSNRNCREYADYGGRGIHVCVSWKAFANFVADMGNRPSARHTLDRINNLCGYWCGKPECPECGPLGRKSNCRWATAKQQSRNTRRNRLLTLRGETRCAAEWAEITGIPARIIARRVRDGWPDERTLTTPARWW